MKEPGLFNQNHVYVGIEPQVLFKDRAQLTVKVNYGRRRTGFSKVKDSDSETSFSDISSEDSQYKIKCIELKRAYDKFAVVDY